MPGDPFTPHPSWPMIGRVEFGPLNPKPETVDPEEFKAKMITAYQDVKKDYPPSPMDDMRKQVIRHCQEFVDESTLKLLSQGYTNIRYEIVPNDFESFQPGLNVRVWGDPPPQPTQGEN